MNMYCINLLVLELKILLNFKYLLKIMSTNDAFIVKWFSKNDSAI